MGPNNDDKTKIGSDKHKMRHEILNISYLLVIHVTFVLGAQRHRLIQTVLLSTYNILMFWLRNTKINIQLRSFI